jgi:hypothetical protein
MTEREKAKKLCKILERSINLMGNIDIEQLNPHTLVMLFNSTANYSGFVQAFNGKVKVILDKKSIGL